MNRDRFETLAETYGGDVDLWPAEARAAAATLRAADADFARAVLARASTLDGLLDTHRTPPPSAALMGRVLASHVAPARWAGWARWLMPAGIGAGLAATCAAGMAMGVLLSPEPDYDAESLIATVSDTSFAVEVLEET